MKFAASSEAYNAEQKSLLEETLDADLAAVAAEIETLQPSTSNGDKRLAMDHGLVSCRSVGSGVSSS